MDSAKLNKSLLNLSFIIFLIDVVVFSWWGSNSQIEYVLPTFCLSFLAILPLCFMREQSFYNKFEKVVFFSGVYLIIYALIGYFNPSMEFLKYVDYTYLKELPFVDYLPTSVKSPIMYGNALSSAMKIASVFFVVMLCIKLFRRQNYVNFTLIFLAINGTLVAIFGIVQKLQAFPMLYDCILTTSDFYATFFLSSTAGVFINMTLAINLALVYFYTKNKNFFRALIFLIFAGICFYSAKLTNSHGTLMLANTTCAFTMIVIVFVGFNKLMKARYSFLLTLVYLGIIGFIFLSTTSLSYIELRKKDFNEGRIRIYEIAFKVIEKYPYFGVGGECSRYILPSETNTIKVEEGKSAEVAPARAHMDILEYFMEFGILGAWVIVLAFFAYIIKFFSKLRYLTPENAILFVGVMQCVAHSMWDLVLHFQSVMIYVGIIAILSLNFIEKRERADDEI